MRPYRWIGKRVKRFDARPKATGDLKYPSDLYEAGMLWGRVLRSEYPHARIKSIDTTRAREVPGVVCVLTHEDVPGLNGYGIERQDQPVLCSDRVRYVGDAVALVGAETKEAADEALRRIAVEYEELPTVTDPKKALEPDAPKLHEGGNLIHELHFERGDPQKAFADADVVVENVYRTQMMDHAFIECEAGFARMDEDGTITVWACGQYAFRDVTQIARSLNYPEGKIRVIEPYTGGAFGGKDEVTVQILLALLALKTGRPCKLWFSREEHMITCTHRHPIEIRMKTAAMRDGTLVAHEIEAWQDGGAYASLSGPVLCLVIEHGAGPYRTPNVKLDGWVAYTNNGLSGAYRGFGATQSSVAMESQMDILAAKIGMDPIELRLKNVVRKGERFGLGEVMWSQFGAKEALEKALEHPLWKEREKIKAELDTSTPENRWKKRGVGVALAFQGSGLGKGLPDYAATTISLDPDGTLLLANGTIEIGQGSYQGLIQVAAEVLQCDPENFRFVGGDTGRTLDSGTTTASRVMYAAGNSTLRAAKNLRELLLGEATRALGLPHEDLEAAENGVRSRKDPSKHVSYAEIAARHLGPPIKAEGLFILPTADEQFSFGLPHVIFCSNVQIVVLDVDTLTGEAEVKRVAAFPDCGTVINPLNVEQQSEGGIVMGIGYALYEENIIQNARFVNPNLTTYTLPAPWEAPEVETHTVEIEEESGPFGARSIAEVVTTPTAPAVLNAAFDAVGVRFKEIPLYPERVLEGLDKNKE